MRQSAVDGLLATVFLKTPFEECEICVQPPFAIEDVAHREGGYMVAYYHSAPRAVDAERPAALVFFLKSKSKQINEVHVRQRLLRCFSARFAREWPAGTRCGRSCEWSRSRPSTGSRWS